MKSIKFALVLFAVILMFNFYFYIYLKNSTGALADSLTEVISRLESSGASECAEPLDKIYRDFEHDSTRWRLAVNHEDVLALDETLLNCLGYAKSDNEGNLAGSLLEARMRVQNIFERERLTLENLF